MAGATFPAWVEASVHENAPDHSVQTVEVGKLREAAATIAELYRALDGIVSEYADKWATEEQLLAAGCCTTLVKAITIGRAALAKADREQVSA